MEIDEVAGLTEALAGVHRTASDGLAQWRYPGGEGAPKSSGHDKRRAHLGP